MLKTVGNPSARSGDQTINDGNLVIGTAGKGIDFSATANATGMTSELLNDYEEGTWTPTYTTDGTGFTSLTYSIQEGTYTKIGRVVYVRGAIETSAVTKGSASGNVLLAGFPFMNSATYTAMTISNMAGFDTNQPSALLANISATNAYIQFRAASNGASSALTVSDIATGAGGNYMRFAGFYFV
jgi:hypothetical protein